MSSVIKVDQIQLANGSTPTAGDLGLNTTGNVINVWMATGTRSRYITTSTSWVEADSSVRIQVTPTSTSSKLLILHQAHIQQDSVTLGACAPCIEVGGTNYGVFAETDSVGGATANNIFASNGTLGEMLRMSGSGNIWMTQHTSGLYQCTSTAVHTVKVLQKMQSGNGIVMGDNGPSSQLIVMEIAG